MRYGLIGNPLGHSWSPKIHALLGDYDYKLYPILPSDLSSFLAQEDLGGLNVTLPYKKDVIPYCSSLTDAARSIGAVNVLKYTDHGIIGDNTDCDGFFYLARRIGIDFSGKKVLILGSGGTSLTARYCAERLGARRIIVISRNGENNYGNLDLHRDAQIIVNTTPLGMYPNNEAQALSLKQFPNLCGVLDVVYNPLRTQLVQEARDLGIPASAGLPMLVAQAVAASERFFDIRIPDEKTDEVLRHIRRGIENIVLIGMPGCGKTSIGREISALIGRPLVDLDAEIAEAENCSVPDIINTYGEAHFRDLETRQVRRFAKESGLVIACGGGTPLREINRRLLRQNGKVFLLHRDLALLPTDGRPLSVNLEELARVRGPIYDAAADVHIENNSRKVTAAQQILEAF